MGVQEGSNKVGETVVNVSGANHVITVGINLATQKTNPLMKTKSEGNALTTNPFIIIGLLLVGITLGVAAATFISKWTQRKRS